MLHGPTGSEEQGRYVVHGTGNSETEVLVPWVKSQVDLSFAHSSSLTVQVGVGLVMLDHVVYVVVGYHSVIYALYWRPSRRGMLSQNVEVATAGKVEKISVDVRVVVYDWDPRLAEMDEYRDQELRQA